MIRVVCTTCQIELLTGGEAGARLAIDVHKMANPGHVPLMVPA